MKKNIQYLTAFVAFRSNLNIQEMGEILSKFIFNSIPFDGLDKNIYDEIPAMILTKNVLGFSIVLSGYSGNSGDDCYNLTFYPEIDFDKSDNRDYEEISIDRYLSQLLKYSIPLEYYIDILE